MSLTDDLINICADFSGIDYFVDELIPDKKLNNARDFFPIPGNTKVIALINTTVFGSNKTGLAICENGIYWRNSWVTETVKNFLPWDEFESIVIKRKNYVIELGPGNNFDLAGSAFKKDSSVNLLQAVQTYIRDEKKKAVWMLHIAGQQFGPYDKAAIKQMLAAGNINPIETYAWRAGMNEWKPFSEVPSLASLVVPPSPTPILRQKNSTMPEPEATPHNRANQSKMFDINSSTMEELLGLPGINLAEAQIIVQERAKRNGFTNIDEVGSLLQLQPHIIEKLREMVAFTEYNSNGFGGRIIDY